MFGLAVWLFAEAAQAPSLSADRESPSRLGFDSAERAIQDGKGPDRAETPVHPDLHNPFREVHLTGKRPPAPVPPGPRGPEPPTTEKPLNEIFLMISLVYHDASQGAQTQVVLRYRPEAGVEVPADRIQVSAGIPGPLASALARSPRDRQGSGAELPTVGDPLLHHVSVGESLWAPYDHIALVEVGEDARSAFFLRAGEPEPEQVFKNELDLDPEMARQLIEGFRNPIPGQTRTGSSWIPVEETRRVGENTYSIGRTDRDLFRQDPQKLLDQLTFRNHRSTGDPSRSGIGLLRVNQELGQRFGVRDGDVILEINEIPVRTKSRIIERIAGLYRDGVREFRVRMMTMGRIEERVYLAPDDR